MSQEPFTGTPSTNPNYWDDQPKESPKVNLNSVSLLDECILDRKVKIDDPPILISCGFDWGNKYRPIMTEGNISAITGLSKSKKSFLKSALIASYIGGVDFGEMRGHRMTKKYVLDFDTEQSPSDALRVFNRTETMGGEYDNYISICLRGKSTLEMLQIIESAIKRYHGQIGLISIDGFADLVDNFNDLERSSQIVSKLMKWSTEQNCHITGIIHLNPSKDQVKPQGHLGSFVLRKCETVIHVEADERDPLTSNVTCLLSRRGDFDDFKFRIEKDIPIVY